MKDLISTADEAQILSDMQISKERAMQIQTESQIAIQRETKGHSPESLRAIFRENPRLADSSKRTENHTDGEYIPFTPVEPNIISYDTAKINFWKCYQYRTRKKSPIITSQNASNLQNILAWMIHSTESISYNKGLFIFGDYGRGKTDLLYALKLFTYHMSKIYDNVPEWPAIRSYKAMIKKAKEEKTVRGIYQDKGISIIDDLGFQEDSTITIWGDKTDLVSEIIESRHRAWKANNNNLSIFTSNLDIDRIKELHGPGISGRLVEMCSIIYWNGADFRTLQNTNA